MKLSVWAFGIGLLIIFGGCIKRQDVVYDQPEIGQSGYYEKAWVDPTIILSDSLYTLIRSDRVDSFYVDQPPDPLEGVAPAVVFQVRQADCFTTVSLLDDRSRVIRPLLSRNLRRGFYKITFNASSLTPELSPSGVFYVKVVYCGFQVVERLTLR